MSVIQVSKQFLNDISLSNCVTGRISIFPFLLDIFSFARIQWLHDENDICMHDFFKQKSNKCKYVN